MVRSRTDPVLSLPPGLAQAFAPIHKRALGTAVAIALGASMALLTTFHHVVQPVNAPDVGLLAHYFYGYSVSPAGIGVGFFWGFVAGFVTGWFIAFVRNLTLNAWLLVLRIRAQLAGPFLDDLG